MDNVSVMDEAISKCLNRCSMSTNNNTDTMGPLERLLFVQNRYKDRGGSNKQTSKQANRQQANKQQAEAASNRQGARKVMCIIPWLP